MFASSSSVYGSNTSMPFSVHDSVDHPLSLTGATKKTNELLAHTYSHLFGVPTTGLRLFTVYGPWGRPDTAVFRFTKAILDGIVDGILRVLDRPAAPQRDWDSDRPDPASSDAPYRLYNIGSGTPVTLLDFIVAIERAVGEKAGLTLLPMQPGEVEATSADISDLTRDVDFVPRTHLIGRRRALVRDWYRSYYAT